MTINEMIKKINAYNEVADEIGQPHVHLGFRASYYDDCLAIEEDPKAFRKHLKDTFIDVAVKAFTDCNTYEFNKEVHLEFRDKWGWELEENITFYTIAE